MRLAADAPVGTPSFDLSDDEVATIIDLIAKGAKRARGHVVAGMLEPAMSILVRKEMKRVKKELGHTNLLVAGELELDDMESDDSKILGRIDIAVLFLRSYDEDEYVGVECKRVGAKLAKLNASYVAEGVERFVTGKYARGHEQGFMVGFVIAVPVESCTAVIKARIKKTYGTDAALFPARPHPDALATLSGKLKRTAAGPIRLHHVFVDMMP